MILFIILMVIAIAVLIGNKLSLFNIKPTYEDLLNTNENIKPTYEDLLNTNEWHDKRESILKRDNYLCKYCGSTYNLLVHHKYYSRYPNGQMVYPWNYPDDALITLCGDCHRKLHKNKQINVYYRKYTDNY